MLLGRRRRKLLESYFSATLIFLLRLLGGSNEIGLTFFRFPGNTENVEYVVGCLEWPSNILRAINKFVPATEEGAETQEKKQSQCVPYLLIYIGIHSFVRSVGLTNA